MWSAADGATSSFPLLLSGILLLVKMPIAFALAVSALVSAGLFLLLNRQAALDEVALFRCPEGVNN